MVKRIHYRCPYCDGSMQYHKDTDLLKCPGCGASMSRSAYMEETSGEDELVSCEGGEVRMMESKVYRCVACGAELVTGEHTQLSACCFCGGTQLEEDWTDSFPVPELVIPFIISRRMATLRFRLWAGPLAPLKILFGSPVKNMTPIYVPCWIYDMDMDVTIEAKGEKKGGRRREGDTIYQETKHYKILRKAKCNYSNVPVDASKRTDDEMMDMLEPYHYWRFRAFQPSDLEGCVTERFDFDSEEMENRLWDKMKYYACEEIAGKITDYRNLTLTGRKIKTDILRARYALLPVWLINYERKGENHQIALNGQTGKLIGSLRISLLKIVLGIAAVGSLFWYLILAFGGWLV